MSMNREAIKEQLTRRLAKLVGEDAVLAGEQELVVYECDAYTLQRNPPTAVVLPRSGRADHPARRGHRPQRSRPGG